MDWIGLGKERVGMWALVNAVMNLLVPLTARNFLTILELVIFSRKTLPYGLSK